MNITFDWTDPSLLRRNERSSKKASATRGITSVALDFSELKFIRIVKFIMTEQLTLKVGTMETWQ